MKNSGDIAVSGKTVQKLLETTDDANAAIWKAYPDSTVDLWDQDIVNGKYVIAYEMNPGLDRKLKSMLPKVRFINRKILQQSLIHIIIILQAMEKIESETCIKFEDRSKNQHQELVSLIILIVFNSSLVVDHYENLKSIYQN